MESQRVALLVDVDVFQGILCQALALQDALSVADGVAPLLEIGALRIIDAVVGLHVILLPAQLTDPTVTANLPRGSVCGLVALVVPETERVTLFNIELLSRN